MISYISGCLVYIIEKYNKNIQNDIKINKIGHSIDYIKVVRKGKSLNKSILEILINSLIKMTYRNLPLSNK